MNEYKIFADKPTEFSMAFLRGMVNRMLTSYYKYGPVKDAAGVTDNLENMKTRVDKYLETGNTEWLMDAANFLMIEYMYPQHPDAHFEATDSKESPGRKDVLGRDQRSKHNLDIEIDRKSLEEDSC